MKVTIEIRSDHKAKLLQIATLRGEKGISAVIAEAIESYLAGKGKTERLRKRALRLGGTLRAREADDLIRALRQSRVSD